MSCYVGVKAPHNHRYILYIYISICNVHMRLQFILLLKIICSHEMLWASSSGSTMHYYVPPETGTAVIRPSVTNML